ncbi:hypothetical protein HanXRQr2_Chr14g0639051 [Helianthus annuus]|uniref:Uncharacterized protein n=1 Tax=Helianthus annuus TaxID=4232 RepID=A0A9K3E9X3_HELAN|nr:hypothetical protein HanXRQr2_Chr14g0639051 [Helianthus annuus]
MNFQEQMSRQNSTCPFDIKDFLRKRLLAFGSILLVGLMSQYYIGLPSFL